MAVHPANSRFLWISAGVGLFLLVILLGFHREEVAHQISRPFKSHLTPGATPAHRNTTGDDDYFEATGERVAYATWYSSTVANGEDWSQDKYFIATRMLAYQLLHDPQTRTRRNIPFIVLCTPDVSLSRRERLAKDGAIIRPIDWLQSENDWFHEGRPNWHGIMSKLYIYDMTEYNRVLLIDGDTVMNKPIDGIWDDPGTKVIKTTKPELKAADEGELPDEYLLASMSEMATHVHEFPPTDSEVINVNLWCAGFFMMHPDIKMLNYIKTVMPIRDRFQSDLMEQSLLNYIHRQDGPMPWTRTSRHWNIRYVNQHDLDSGVVSAHWKYWEWPTSNEQSVHDFMYEVRWRMEGFYKAYDEYKTTFPKYVPSEPKTLNEHPDPPSGSTS